MSTGEGKLRSVAELSGNLKNRGFKKSAITVVSKELCGAAAVDPLRIETKKSGEEGCVTTLKTATEHILYTYQSLWSNWHYPGDMAVRMCEVLARPWAGVCVPVKCRIEYRAKI